MEVWVQSVESLEAVHQRAPVRRVDLRPAGHALGGRPSGSAAAAGSDEKLDAEAKANVLEPARRERFFLGGGLMPATTDLRRDAGYNAAGTGD